MRRTTACILLVAMGALLATMAAASPAAAEACVGTLVTHQFDYGDDVRNVSTDATTATRADIDLIEVQSCLIGTDIVVDVRVDGQVVVDDPDVEYTVWVFAPDFSSVSVSYSNGTAFHYDIGSGFMSMNNSTVAAWLTVHIPAALLDNITGNWTVEAQVGADDDSSGFFDWMDHANLDPTEADAGGDIAAEVSPFAQPTVAITSVNVTEVGGGHFVVVAQGTTQGPVAELRVSMGAGLTAAGVTTWLYTGFWTEESLAAGDPKVALEKQGGAWAQWRFERNYTEAQLRGAYGTLFTLSGAKLEVRAFAQDGRWGHANSTFQPLTATPPSDGGGGGGGGGMGGSSLLLPLLLVVVVAAAAVGAFLVMKRKKQAPPPPAGGAGAPPPGNPPQPPLA